MRNVTTNLGVEAYETPSCSVVEMYMEGVLCQSGSFGDFTHDGIDDSDEGTIF